jgi:hypothetical protein
MHTSAHIIHMKRHIYRSTLETAANLSNFPKLLQFPVPQNSPILQTWLLMLPHASQVWQLQLLLLHLVTSVTALELGRFGQLAGYAEHAIAQYGDMYVLPESIHKP